jgi:hypothetical protein
MRTSRRHSVRCTLATIILVMLVAVVVPTATAPPAAAAIESLAGCTASSLPATDDGSSSEVQLPFTLGFFGQSFTSAFVNNNGNVTFGGPLQ